MKKFLAIFPFILPLYVVRFSIGPIPTTLLEIFFAVWLIAYLFERGLKGLREGWNRLGEWRWPTMAWFAATLIAVFIAPSFVAALGLWRAFVLEPLVVFVMLADLVRDEETAKRIRDALFWTVIALAGIAVVQFFSGWGIPSPWNVAILDGRRATGPFPYPNALSLFVGPIGVWAFGRNTQHATRNIKSLEMWTWIASLVAMVLARSDGGLIAFAAVAVLSLLLDARSRRWMVGVLAAAVLLVAFLPMLRTPLWKLVSFQGWSGQVRVTMWRETVEMLKDRPMFGAGFGGYPIVFKPYHKATYIEIFQYPHNILLNLWSETGVLGIVVFGWIAWTWFRLGRRRGFAAVAPLVAILIHGLVDVPYFKNDLAMVFWLLVFLTTVVAEEKPISLPASTL
jgi:O-antigen ligase